LVIGKDDIEFKSVCKGEYYDSIPRFFIIIKLTFSIFIALFVITIFQFVQSLFIVYSFMIQFGIIQFKILVPYAYNTFLTIILLVD